MVFTKLYTAFVYLITVALVCQAAATTLRDLMHLRHGSPMTKRQYDSSPGQLMPEQQMCYTIPHLQVLKEQFANYIDSNHDERASPEEILNYLRKYSPDISDEQVLAFIARRDKDGDGSVDFIPDYLMEASSPDFDMNTAREWFTLEDTNGDGYVSKDELITIAEKVGMSPQEAKETVYGYYMSADQNGDSRLSWQEYMPLYLPVQ